MVKTGDFNPQPSSPFPQKAMPPSSPLHEAEEASCNSSPATFIDAQNHTFYRLCSLLDSIPDIPITFPYLLHALWGCMSRMTSHCTICYFLRHKRPIKVVLTDQRGAHFEDNEEYDDHANDFTCCPWRLLTDRLAYHYFSSEVSASLRRNSSGGCGWFICSICAEPWNMPTYHQHCVYGPDTFLLAYLVWEDLPTRDSVFTLLYENSISFPDLQDRSAYAMWLGSNVSHTIPTLNNIHLLVVAYHLLRWAGELPSVPSPDVEDMIVYRVKRMR